MNKLKFFDASINNKRIVNNTLMLYFRMILSMLVSLYTSRVILNTLGVEDYGIYNVVGGVVSMFAFFNSAMSNATQRFLSYEIGKSDFLQLRKTFNATQAVHVGIAVLIFLLAETIGLWFVKTYLVLPVDRMEAAIWVYHFSVLSFIVTIIQVPYNATIIAHERMNVYAYVSLLEVSLKLLIIFLLVQISFDKLKLYSVLYFVVVLIIAAIYRIYTQCNFEESKFEVVRDKKLYISLVKYSSWSLFGNIAGVAKVQGVNILLNIFFGPVLNAARGVSMQVQSAVQSFVTNFQMAVNPQIIKSYAADRKEYMISLIIRSSKFSFYLMFIISLPIILEIEQILRLWLKIVPEFSSVFTMLVLIIILIDCVSGPLMTAIQATGEIKVYQAIVGSLIFLILPISYIFLKLGYSPEITLYINVVVSIISLIFRLYIVGKLLNFPIMKFVYEVILKNCIIIPVALSVPLFLKFLMNEDLVRLVILVPSTVAWNALIIYLIGLNYSEKQIINKGIISIFRIRRVSKKKYK